MDSHPSQRVDELTHQRVRLGVLAVLSGRDRATFTDLRDVLGQSDGALGRHLRVLEEAGYVVAEKTFENRRPRTWISLTDSGRAAIATERDALAELIGALGGAAPAAGPVRLSPSSAPSVVPSSASPAAWASASRSVPRGFAAPLVGAGRTTGPGKATGGGAVTGGVVTDRAVSDRAEGDRAEGDSATGGGRCATLILGGTNTGMPLVAEGPVGSGFTVPEGVERWPGYDAQRMTFLSHGLRDGYVRRWAREQGTVRVDALLVELSDESAPRAVLKALAEPTMYVPLLPHVRGYRFDEGDGVASCVAWLAYGPFLACVSLTDHADLAENRATILAQTQFMKLAGVRPAEYRPGEHGPSDHGPADHQLGGGPVIGDTAGGGRTGGGPAGAIPAEDRVGGVRS
ncbi:winged helix-turn-helix domain-containing protein [Rugosimonospora africana]|uniref:Winged helix DNA-binding domain-containing protein n=1 Tax=Rugosimonospora africana TaxID=556532 RepID=A0A8J3QX62_9ACTN|nr:transcriptional regulator [Rugosimonospora africana]GIH17390.1 hypothetical protein Raf01_55620 [Rugosimonospora africana]